jgi:hypothetical protein
LRRQHASKTLTTVPGYFRAIASLAASARPGAI